MFATLKRTKSFTPEPRIMSIGESYKAQLIRLPEVGHRCYLKNFATGIVTRIISQTKSKIKFETEFSEFVLIIHQ